MGGSATNCHVLLNYVGHVYMVNSAHVESVKRALRKDKVVLDVQYLESVIYKFCFTFHYIPQDGNRVSNFLLLYL